MNQIAPKNKPVILIAGPLRGVDLEQRRETLELMSNLTDASIASPIFMNGQELHPDFNDPVEWAWHHFYHAVSKGVIFFWFPRQNHRLQNKNNIYFDHPFGINAERLLGLCVGLKKSKPKMKVVVGSDPEYGRLKSLEDFLKFSNSGLVIHYDLDECCTEAVSLI